MSLGSPFLDSFFVTPFLQGVTLASFKIHSQTKVLNALNYRFDYADRMRVAMNPREPLYLLRMTFILTPSSIKDLFTNLTYLFYMFILNVDLQLNCDLRFELGLAICFFGSVKS